MLVERRDIIAEDWAREVLLRDRFESFSGASVRVLNGGGTPTVSRVRQ